MNLVNFLINVGTSGLVSAGVCWLLKEWIGRSIEHRYQKQLEQIRIEHAKDLATLNNALQETRDFKSIRFRSVFDRKISALCETFGKLVNLEKCLREYVGKFGDITGPERDEARREFGKALRDFENFFLPIRIFFPIQLAEQLTEVKNAMRTKSLEFMGVASEHTPPLKFEQVWDQVNVYVDKELPRLRREIEAEIRIELGENTK